MTEKYLTPKEQYLYDATFSFISAAKRIRNRAHSDHELPDWVINDAYAALDAWEYLTRDIGRIRASWNNSLYTHTDRLFAAQEYVSRHGCCIAEAFDKVPRVVL